MQRNPTHGFVVYLALIAAFIAASLPLTAAPDNAALVFALWAGFIIRPTLSEGPNSLLDALRLFATIIAANAALAWEPAASFSDIGKIAALTALIIPAYLVLIWAFPSQRPAQMGLRFGWPFWICVFSLLNISFRNFGNVMRDDWGLALINTLFLAAFFLNAALPLWQSKTPFGENWRGRLMAATSLPLGMYGAFSWPNIVRDQGTSITVLITVALLTLALFTLSLWLERRLQPK